MIDKNPFVIVCGLPRSGTRQFTDILNQDPRICLQAEVSPVLIPKMHDLLSAADRAYARHSSLPGYLAKRAEIIVQLLSGFSKGRRNIKPSAVVHGFKTPSVEKRYKTLCEMILPSYGALNFFFCVRGFTDCYLSLSSMPWFNKTPEEYTNIYVKSLATAVKIGSLPEKAVSISCLNLDEFITAEDKGTWLHDHLFSRVPVSISKERSGKYYSKTRNINATKRVTGEDRRNALSDSEATYFSSRLQEINQSIQAFNQHFKSAVHEVVL